MIDEEKREKAIEMLNNDKTINAKWNPVCDCYDEQIGDKEIDEIITLIKDQTDIIADLRQGLAKMNLDKKEATND